MPGLKITIVGAGIAGLATAIALRQSGHKVLIIEKKASKRDAGFAVTIPPNAVQVLESLGLDLSVMRPDVWKGVDLVRADVSPIEWQVEKAYDKANEDGKADKKGSKKDGDGGNLERETLQTWVTHRADYHQALMEKAVSREGPGEPAVLRIGENVVAWDAGKGSARLESGEIIYGDLVVAADGVHSEAHIQVVGEERPATAKSWSCVRFALPTEIMSKDEGMSKLLARGEGKGGMYHDSDYKTMLYRAPMRKGTLQNFGVYALTETPEKKQLKDADDPTSKTYKELAIDRLSHLDAAIANVPKYAAEDDMYLWRIADRDPLPAFYKEKLVLVGDACHPMHSFLGQGAAQAVEDAGVLGIVLQNINSSQELPDRLALWQELRLNRASTAQILSRSETVGPWKASVEDQEKAEQYFAIGDGPLTRLAVFEFFYGTDYLGFARKAFQKCFGNELNTRVS